MSAPPNWERSRATNAVASAAAGTTAASSCDEAIAPAATRRGKRRVG